MYLEINERPRAWILWTCRVGLLLCVLLLFNQALFMIGIKEGAVNQALVVMIGMLFIACCIGSFFKRVSVVDKKHQELSTKYSFIVDFAKKCYSFDQLSSVYVRKELADMQGADLSRQANTSYKTPLFIVIVDLKGYGKGPKRIRVKKCFKLQEADDLAAHVATLIAQTDL